MRRVQLQPLQYGGWAGGCDVGVGCDGGGHGVSLAAARGSARPFDQSVPENFDGSGAASDATLVPRSWRSLFASS